MDDTYKTIAAPSMGIYKEKGSKFIALAFPVSGDEEVKLQLDKTRKKYHDARHHCYACRLGTAQVSSRSVDDGEPAHTAGAPILGQIQAFQLTNILVIVVRYFGGTLLGTGGLIQAYKSAAREALLKATIITISKEKRIRICYDYGDLNMVMKIVGEEHVTIHRQQFDRQCIMELGLRAGDAGRVVERLRNVPSIAVSFSEEQP